MSGLSLTARALLLASLALNVILGVALLVAAPWSDGRRDGARPRHGGIHGLVDPRALRAALAAEHHDVLDAALQSHRDAMRAHLGRLFEARQAVRAAILTEPFDRVALDAAFERLRESETATATEAQALLGDVLVQASVEERRRLADLMPHRPPRHRTDGGAPPRP